MKYFLPPFVFIALNLFISGPASIFSGNESEFEIGLVQILTQNFLYILTAFFATCALALLCPRKIFSWLISFMFIFGVCLWLQGNIFVWKYSLNKDIDWTENIYRGVIDSTVWFVLIGCSFVFHRQIVRKSTLLSFVFIALQFLYIGFLSAQQPEIWTAKDNMKELAPPEDLFKFSDTQNVLHIVLDELQSTVFQQIINTDKSYYSSQLDGFTFFKETTGCFPTTIMSIPAFLSGQIYQNHVPIPQFIKTAYQGKTITNIAYDHGFEVDMATLSKGWYGHGKSTNYYFIPVPYAASRKTHLAYNARILQRLVLFRYAPFFLKKYTTAIFPSLKHIDYQAGRHFAHRAFLQDLIEKASLGRKKPVYKLIHLTTTHYPAVLTASCHPAESELPFTWENIKIQAKCSFDHVLQLLTALKRLGLYDTSLILIHADHGYYKVPNSLEEVRVENLNSPTAGGLPADTEAFSQIVASALPTLLVKPPFSRGALKISTVQASLKDLPDTLSDLLGFDDAFGEQSVYKQTPERMRARSFNYAQIDLQGKDFFERIDTYDINGSAMDRRSWHFSGTLLSPAAAVHEIQSIDLGTSQDQAFLKSGWAKKPSRVSGVACRWTMGKRATLSMPIPKDKRIALSAVMAAPFYNDSAQSIGILLNGEKIGNWHLLSDWHWETRSIVVEPDENRPEVSLVEFEFSQQRPPDEKSTVPLAALFDTILIKEQQPSE